MNSVLVTEPVGALHCVVHVPSPVVLVHVAEGGVDATLGSDCVTSRGEELGNAGSVEAGLSETEGGTETGTTGTNNDRIVLMVLQAKKAFNVSTGRVPSLLALGSPPLLSPRFHLQKPGINLSRGNRGEEEVVFDGREEHTMTGYLLLTNGDASFARRGPLAITRAARVSPSGVSQIAKNAI